MTEENVVHDPQVLRAIAHPLRNRILGELAAQGPLRAADVARELDIPANRASFHLRQLAKYGLVEEDPGAARDKRDRVWRQVDARGLTIQLDEFDASPGGKASAEVFRRNAASWAHVIVESAYSTERDEGVRRSVTEISVRLTRDEAAEMGDELSAVVDRWVERTRGRDESRRTYLYFGAIMPYPSAVDVTRGA